MPGKELVAKHVNATASVIAYVCLSLKLDLFQNIYTKYELSLSLNLTIY